MFNCICLGTRHMPGTPPLVPPAPCSKLGCNILKEKQKSGNMLYGRYTIYRSNPSCCLLNFLIMNKFAKYNNDDVDIE